MIPCNIPVIADLEKHQRNEEPLHQPQKARVYDISLGKFERRNPENKA
jgi:hypothetical protein